MTQQVKDRLKMHKQREEDRISGALRKPSAEDEFDSRVRESEVRPKKSQTAELLPILYTYIHHTHTRTFS